MNALDIARAACMEVGLDPGLVNDSGRRREDGTPILTGSWLAPRDTYRALMLATMAAYGPDVMRACFDCYRIPGGSSCTPVRDALIGRTCGRSSLTAPWLPTGRAVEQVGGDAQPPLRVPPADHL